jgi:hypothetical protein
MKKGRKEKVNKRRKKENNKAVEDREGKGYEKDDKE